VFKLSVSLPFLPRITCVLDVAHISVNHGSMLQDQLPVGKCATHFD
jgi:hypothetical protein